jgi:2-polyprenyl-3-methyl-5-hydroxy-6-metoxy-1,4-benzoquinol methylase
MNAQDRRDIERFFDEVGEGEWNRFAEDDAAVVSLELHRRLLRRFVQPGMQVLDVGAGPGRFTIELAALGATVLVSDISATQLDLARQHIADAGFGVSILGYKRLDVCDLSSLDDQSFDVVVAYGGVVSYAFEDAVDAPTEMFRVVRPGGVVLGSVMSLAGNARRYLPSFPAAIDAIGVSAFDRFLATGDQRVLGGLGAHACRLFTSGQLSEVLAEAGGTTIAMSASGWLALADPESVAAFLESSLREPFLDWEERMCGERGAVDGGTHLLFAAKPGH